MQAGSSVASGEYQDLKGRRREDWLSNALITGFAATIAMTIAVIAGYWVARGLGDETGNTVQQWLYALHNNSLTESTQERVVIAIAANLGIGIGWAILYGYSFAPRLEGPNWRRGMVFSLIPFALSVLIFFPIVGAGILGRDLGAGPLPVAGNLILHLLFGAILGSLYAVDLESWLDGSESDLHHNRSAESGAAYGMIIGAQVGLVLAWQVAPSVEQIASLPIIALLGTVLGAALGLLIGSFAGIDVAGKRWSERTIKS